MTMRTTPTVAERTWARYTPQQRWKRFVTLLVVVAAVVWAVESIDIIWPWVWDAPAQVGDLFGRKRYATIRGLLSPIYNVALFIMPVAAGWVFDTTGSYRIVMLVGAGLLTAAALTFLTIKKPVH